MTSPTLALPDSTKPFIVEIDACEYGVGAVLQQEGHPIAYLSKALDPRTKGALHVREGIFGDGFGS